VKRLRTGFTTGTYAAATTLAAGRLVCGRRNGSRISLLFPDGRTRRVNVNGWRKTEDGATAWAIKDAGDDIDVTNRAVVRTTLTTSSEDSPTPEDYLERCGKARIILSAGSGVGLVTRPGLDVEPGKWAINPVPRRMIVENLQRAGIGESAAYWRVTVSINNGQRLARKTLNPMLGVEGGLSVLGTSGIVVPCSNAAYIKTIEILLRGVRRGGCGTAFLVTGGER